MGSRELSEKQIMEVLYHGRTMVNFHHVPSVTRAIDWLSQDFRKALEELPEPAPDTLRERLPDKPTLTFGDGDYSCASCGMGMQEPCEHWKRLLASAPTPAATPQLFEADIDHFEVQPAPPVEARAEQPTIEEIGVGDAAWAIAAMSKSERFNAEKLGQAIARFAINYAKEQVQAAEQAGMERAAQLEKALRACEWGDCDGYNSICPACQASEKHTPECIVGRALATSTATEGNK